jgi:hypothetical protein
MTWEQWCDWRETVTATILSSWGYKMGYDPTRSVGWVETDRTFAW